MATRRGIGVALAAATVTVAGCSSAVPHPGAASGTDSTTMSSSAAKSVVTTDHLAFDSAATLAGYSDYVVGGTFVAVVGSGVASTYGMGPPVASEPAVQVWSFHVDQTFKGVGPSDVLVARYAPAKVVSDEATIQPGLRAVVFLSQERGGARVVIGGNQGILLEAPDGELTPLPSGAPTIAGAATVGQLQAALP